MAQPVSIKASGLPPRSRVTVRLTSTDARGVHWRSSARVRASSDGTIDLDRDRSRGGSYEGVDGMGLMMALAPQDRSQPTSYYWPGLDNPQEFTVKVSTSRGHPAGTTTFRRTAAPGVVSTSLTVKEHGFDGDLHRRSDTSAKRPAVLAFGGSEGGSSTGLLGAALAARGYPTLSVAYFRAPGLPKDLVKIPLEYFAKALRWLRRQPGVDPDRIYVLGMSRGSEAAQLVALHYPGLVHGVVAAVPSNVVEAGLRGTFGTDMRAVHESAWSFHGRPVPYTQQFSRPDPTDVPEAVIPVERIKGPILLVCGNADAIWSSCAFSHAIVDRLEEHRSRYPHVLAEYPDAGHGVGSLLPYEPVGHPMNALQGAEPLANQRARADVWPKLLDFLQEK